MPRFGQRSLRELGTCHLNLQQLAHEVIRHYDLVVISGYRGEDEQERLFSEGRSRLHYPQSRHNAIPSEAIDVAPWVSGAIPWTEPPHFYFMAGFVLATAAHMGLKLRWGGDWDGDGIFSDQTFHDLGHFELRLDASPVLV